MSSAVVETNDGQQEGGDTLKAFLLEHKNVLKKGLDAIYKVLQENEIEEYEELIEFAEMDLRKILDPNKTETKIKDVHIGRLINILRNVPESTIYKTSNKIEKIVKILVSNEEEEALNKINDKSMRIKQYISTITDTINDLKQNQVNNKKEINKQIGLIITAAQKRKQELLNEIDKMVQDKTAKLNKQMNDLQNNQNALDECYNKSQEMLNDTNYDTIKRKAKILENTQKILNKDNMDNFSLITSSDITTAIDINDIISSILITGNVSHRDKPNAPIISTNDIKSNSITLNIQTKDTNIIGYKLQYKESINNNQDIKQDDDMKINWTNIEINNINNNINYQVSSLKPSTNYLFYGFVKSKNGLGYKSQSLTAKTLEQKRDSWDRNTIGSNISFVDNDTIRKTSDGDWTVLLTKTVSSGVHVWTFKIIKANSSMDWFVIGVWKGQSNPPKDKFFTNYSEGRGFCVSRGYISKPNGGRAHKARDYGLTCKDGDIVAMYVDMTRLSVKYTINGIDYGEAFKIERAHYRAAICVYHAAAEIKLIKYEQPN